jgi:hypothetical protein
MHGSIDNSENVIDSRAIVTRIDELEAYAEEALEEDEKEELRILRVFKANVEQIASEDFEDGLTLIRDSYFNRYCQEMCSDIGALPKNLPSYIVIDWEATAHNLMADYSVAEFDGVEYYVRDC